MNTIIGLKELREQTEKYITAVGKGKSFTVVRRSRPIFRISPADKESEWEEVIDFTQVRKGGVRIEEILKRI